jgi:hypothetical protein
MDGRLHHCLDYHRAQHGNGLVPLLVRGRDAFNFSGRLFVGAVALVPNGSV